MPMSNADIVRRGDHNVQLAGARTEAAIGREARLVRGGTSSESPSHGQPVAAGPCQGCCCCNTVTASTSIELLLSP